MSELAEGARLEIVCAVKSGTEGSNPSLSSTFNFVKPIGALSISNVCLRYFIFRCQSLGSKVQRSKVQRLNDSRVHRIRVKDCSVPQPLNPEP